MKIDGRNSPIRSSSRNHNWNFSIEIKNKMLKEERNLDRDKVEFEIGISRGSCGSYSYCRYQLGTLLFKLNLFQK